MSSVHTYPVNDLREHITNGDPCPCLPRTQEDGRLVIHNSYDGREIGEVCIKALDALGLALTGHGHVWTEEERDAYEHALHVLSMHYEVNERET